MRSSDVQGVLLAWTLLEVGTAREQRRAQKICGIFGVVARDPRVEFDVEIVRRCAERLARRGPDAEGVLAARGYAFAHRRLSVIDPDSRSDQPFRDAATGVIITYNGEIFNFRKLRRTLEAAGHEFLTSSDTEAVLRSYLQWGMRFIERLDGMFAFGLHDPRTKQTLIVRDRLGIKPLYYAETAEGVAFASQPTALLSWPGVRSKPDPVGLSSFLSYRSVLGSRSLFREIRKLEPGCLLRLTAGKLEHERWWRCAAEQGQGSFDPSEVRQLLARSVEDQLVADVPLAALLSGGIDSSILAYEIASRASPKPVCFTGVVQGSDYDESQFARAVADKFGLEHRLVDIPIPTDIDLVDELIGYRGHPLGMHNETAMFELARQVGTEHKVVMTGEGADEIFAGYSRLFRAPFDHARQALALRLPRPIGSRLWRRWGVSDACASELDFFLNRYTYFPQCEKLSLARPSWREAIDNDRDLKAHFAAQFEEAGGSFFNRISYVFMATHLPALLEMVDNTTMAAGVEGRVPFTDHKLVSAAMSLPEADRLRWNSLFAPIRAFLHPVAHFSERLDTSKFILKRLYRDVLPPTVLNRRKLGFPLPLGQWAAGPRSEPFRKLLFDGDAAVADIFDMTALKQWYERNRASPHDDFGKRLWLICNLELFMRRFGC